MTIQVLFPRGRLLSIGCVALVEPTSSRPSHFEAGLGG
jgi:hypothetical protein